MINLEDVKTLSLKPDQVLVLQTTHPLIYEIRQQLKDYVKSIFPHNRVMIIDKSIQLLVVDPE